MKTLELKLKKDVLIVDAEGLEITQGLIFNKFGNYNLSYYEFICKGSELTEEIASELVETHKNCRRYFDYKIKERNRFFDLSIPSFISAVESKGFYWLKNPIGEEPRSYSEVIDGILPDELMDDLKEWQEAEEKTFKNSLIFVKNV